MNNLEEKILNKIKNENLKPTSIWYFLIKDYSLWVLVFLSIVFTAIALAPIFFILSNIETEFIKHIAPNSFTFILYNIPYFWIIISIIFIYLSSLAWSKTKNAYKFSGKYLLILASFLSIILGLSLHNFRFGKMLDEDIGKFAPRFYEDLQSKRDKNWFNEGEGRLIGIVKNISTSSEIFTLVNEKNKFVKEVIFTDDIPGINFIELENKVRVVGFLNEDDKFFACAVFPDKLTLYKERIKKDMRKDMRKSLGEDCKMILEQGRMNFKK